MINGQPWYVYIINDAPHWIEFVAAWSTVAASVVAAVSAVLILRQIRQTQRSVKATEDALELAHEEQRFNRNAILDNQRASIDAEMPRLMVLAGRLQSVTDPDELAPRPLQSWDSPKAYDLEHTRLAMEIVARVTLEWTVTVFNDGPRRALVRLAMHSSQAVSETVIDVDAKALLSITCTRTVAEWIELIDSNDPVEIASITYRYPGEVGAIEHHVLTQLGSPIILAPDDGAVIFSPNLMEGAQLATSIVVQPFTRTYYGSMSEGRELPASAS